MLEKSYFSKFKNNNIQHPEFPLNIQREMKISVKNDDLEQVHLGLGFPLNIDYNNEDYFALYLLKFILVGGMSSRLFIKLREENGLSYTVSVDIGRYKECGYINISTGFDKNSLFINKSIDKRDNFEVLIAECFEQDIPPYEGDFYKQTRHL